MLWMVPLSHAECVTIWEEDERAKRKSATQMFLLTLGGCRNNSVDSFPFPNKTHGVCEADM